MFGTGTAKTIAGPKKRPTSLDPIKTVKMPKSNANAAKHKWHEPRGRRAYRPVVIDRGDWKSYGLETECSMCDTPLVMDAREVNYICAACGISLCFRCHQIHCDPRDRCLHSEYSTTIAALLLDNKRASDNLTMHLRPLVEEAKAMLKGKRAFQGVLF